jgi:hypothetical protein
MLGMAKTSSPSEPFTPVAVRARHDGWSPQRQHDFIAALAESGCVAEACAAVGMSAMSAYRLRARPDASTFRQAWDVALDYAVRRLGDAAFSRALHGVPRPIFYKGEQVGEYRHHDERLTMFLLRYRDPVRYGAWLDGYEARRHPDGAGIVLAHALNAVCDAAHGEAPAPESRDGDEYCAPEELAARLPRPIAEGPAPPVNAPCPDYDGPEELRDLFEHIRAVGLARDRAEFDNDPATDDWRAPLPVRRSRRRSKGDPS